MAISKFQLHFLGFSVVVMRICEIAGRDYQLRLVYIYIYIYIYTGGASGAYGVGERRVQGFGGET